MATLRSVDVRQFINERPMSRYQWLILALCFLVVAVDGVDVAIMGFIAPAVLKEWSLSKAAFGVVMSAAPFGLVLGALVAGPTSDKLGRKTVLAASVAVFGLFTLWTAAASSVTEMAVLRLLTGVGLGAAMPNASTLLSEYVPERSRSLLVTLMFTGFNLGSAVVGFMAAAVLPSHGWRAVLQLGGVMPLVLLPLLLLFLPESCRFMAVRGIRRDRIAKVLGKVSGQRFGEDVSFVSTESVSAIKAPVSQLFAKGYRLMTPGLWVTYFMGLMVIYLLTGWLPTLFKESGLDMADAARITAMFQIGGTVGAIVVGWFMDRRKPTAVISLAYLAGAISIVALGLTGGVGGSLALIVTLVGFCMSGAQTGLNAYAPSCYPTAARATGVSWMLGMGRFGSILGSLVGGVLLGLNWQFGAIVMLLAIPAALAAVAVLGSRQRGLV
ncbi:MFS transporter [Ideonella azotifigens]|uniref:Aromatic acid/H+ symport family MFS transporter n=1 Tax=Ideonella azotifigens TaxID=513160 RepID=A0ABN1KGT5_9BURK|nr:MFS transporter [Ideonella azotifigens]MCD2340333.1 MFS transporter [Ideonella azotifigens]